MPTFKYCLYHVILRVMRNNRALAGVAASPGLGHFVVRPPQRNPNLPVFRQSPGMKLLSTSSKSTEPGEM